MAFNKSKVKGMENLDVASQLLSSISKQVSDDNKRTEYISFDLLDPSDLNKDLSKNDIESLAEQIYHDGLDQPLVVIQKSDGRYEVLGGGRRLLAIELLIKQERYPSNHLVECKIKRLKDNTLPLSDDDKRKFTWLSTNQYRDKTDYDRYIEATIWKELILKLKEQKISLLVAGYDENGDVIEIDMKGRRTRELIAEQTGISTTQVGKIETIDKNATESLKSALKNNKINIANASNVSKLNIKDQERFVDTVVNKKEENEIVSADETNTFIADINSKKLHKIIVEKKEINDDIEDIDTILGAMNGTSIELTEKEYKDYKKCISTIKSLLK